MHTNLSALLAVLLYTSAASPVFAASLTALGALPRPDGSLYSTASGVSADGSAVIGVAGAQEAFRWTAGSGAGRDGSRGTTTLESVSASQASLSQVRCTWGQQP
jgi:hypothetical protein